MDGLLLRATDRLGDWLQEEQGVVLPSLLKLTVSLNVLIVAAYPLLLHVYADFSVASVAIHWAVWSLSIVMNLKNHARYSADEERWESENVRLWYQISALVHRDMWITKFLRVFGVSFLTFNSVVIAVYIYLGTEIADHAVYLMLFAALTLNEYAECIAPKTPGRRRRTVLKLALETGGF